VRVSSLGSPRGLADDKYLLEKYGYSLLNPKLRGNSERLPGFVLLDRGTEALENREFIDANMPSTLVQRGQR